MFITISISIVINIIIMSLYLWNKRSSIKVATLPNENNIHDHQQVLFDKLYKNAMAITVGQQKHVLALHNKQKPEEEQLDVENTFNELIELLTIDVNTDKIKHLFLYKDINKLLTDHYFIGSISITTRLYLWVFRQRLLHLYSNHRIINNEYIQQCYKDDYLLISVLLPIFDNHHDKKQLLLNNISESLLGRLIYFNNLLANQSVVIIMDGTVVQQYTLSITDIPNEQSPYLHNINLILPSIGFKSQVCKTEYPPLYNDVLPDSCIDIATCMINVSQLWQYEKETGKQHLLKKYKSINTSNNSSLAFIYNQKVWKFALVEGDEIGSMNYMVFNCIKMLIASQDSVTAANFDNKFIHYWFNHLYHHIS